MSACLFLSPSFHRTKRFGSIYNSLRCLFHYLFSTLHSCLYSYSLIFNITGSDHVRVAFTNMATDMISDSEYEGIETPNTPVPIDPDSVTTNSLQALQSEDQRKVMDIVDKLRRTGLSGIVELPQLVVCGDQSSGKSSVLEAITEIPFPRKENLCTRFATEIILRRSASSTSTITITPDKLRPKSEQAKLKSFSKSINDFSQLPDVIEEATLAMGLGVVGGINSRAFSRDVLSVEITGPARPQLYVAYYIC